MVFGVAYHVVGRADCPYFARAERLAQMVRQAVGASDREIFVEAIVRKQQQRTRGRREHKQKIEEKNRSDQLERSHGFYFTFFYLFLFISIYFYYFFIIFMCVDFFHLFNCFIIFVKFVSIRVHGPSSIILCVSVWVFSPSTPLTLPLPSSLPLPLPSPTVSYSILALFA